MSERRVMIDGVKPLPVVRQCTLVDLARSTAYYRPAPVPADDLRVMRLIDEIHLRLPFYGSRRIRDELEDRGERVNRKRIQRLMRLMGLVALYPKRRTSAPGKGHKIYPYLLRGLTIDRPNQVWATDIVYGVPSLRRDQGRYCRSLSMSGIHRGSSWIRRSRCLLSATREHEPKRR